MTCTDTSSPTRRDAAAPASVAAFTAPTSPRTITVTNPPPTFSLPSRVTLAALTIASAASMAPTRPFVSIKPSAIWLIAGISPVGHGAGAATSSRVLRRACMRRRRGDLAAAESGARQRTDVRRPRRHLVLLDVARLGPPDVLQQDQVLGRDVVRGDVLAERAAAEGHRRTDWK